MAVREIKKYPDEVLGRKAELVQDVDDGLRRLADDMVETMYAAPGIGLAAPQVGVSKRLIVVHVTLEDEESPLIVLFNPEIVEAEDVIEFEEGCLSLPGFTCTIKRSASVAVKGLDRDGRPVTVHADGLLAVALQHEIDHLDGVLLLDKASAIKREFYKKKVKKQLAKVG